jgi:hypothetical protein
MRFLSSCYILSENSRAAHAVSSKKNAVSGTSCSRARTNLHLMMAQQMGVRAESFADSTGKLRELSEV